MSESKSPRELLLNEAQKMESAIRSACGTRFGILDSNFLCRSVSILDPADPITLDSNASLQSACQLLQKHSIGCILIIDEEENLVGVFSERDYMMRVFEKVSDLSKEQVKDYMTDNPITIEPDTPIAFCLNLMSKGGFRHMPILDPDGMPVSIVSIRDVVDYLVGQFLEDLEKV